MQNTNKPIIRYRLLREAHEEILAQDPNSGISRNYLRKIFLAEVVPTIRVGNRRLVNFDALLDFLNNGGVAEQEQAIETGKIRRVG